ncbi:MAG: bifunctional hydroxymethylpyrimidine kinase/phosphomethylpyrimidine kinase, partial [Thermoplasmata archaeon]|nr:bifunctional hydroxymethylpyrimidine kinase/phosphomethylpyrimidine kinase [Thermoplasmata archaeon]
ASFLTGRLAQGDGLEEAILRAKRWLYNRILRSRSIGKGIPVVDLVSSDEDVREEVARASKRYVEHVPMDHVPEVGSNIAYAFPYAITPGEIAALEGRIVRSDGGPRAVGCPILGGAHHTARIVLAVMNYDPSKRCAINIRYKKESVKKAADLGLKIGTFKRAKEPPGAKSMEWGTCYAIETLGEVPDIIYDEGGVGKEPMIRVIARDPGAAMDVLERIVG